MFAGPTMSFDRKADRVAGTVQADDVSEPVASMSERVVGRLDRAQATRTHQAGEQVAFISYVLSDKLSPSERVADPDHIIQIHAVHPAVMRQHFDLYRELMHGRGPLTRREREILALRVSGLNHCPY